MNHLGAIERLYRRMLRVQWMEYVSNNKNLRKILIYFLTEFLDDKLVFVEIFEPEYSS